MQRGGSPKAVFCSFGQLVEQLEIVGQVKNWVVVSKMFYFHPENWGRFPF